MMHTKRATIFFCLLSIIQTECASQIVSAAIASCVGAGMLSGLAIKNFLAYKEATKYMISNSNIKEILDMLNTGKDCTISFTCGNHVRIDMFSDIVQTHSTYEKCSVETVLNELLASPGLRGKGVDNIYFHSGDVSLQLDSILWTRGNLQDLLERVDSLEAPVAGFKVPALRRLINRLAKFDRETSGFTAPVIKGFFNNK